MIILFYFCKVDSKTKILFAPLQGFTDFHFRNAYQKYFGDVEQFYSPWIKLDGSGNIKKITNQRCKPGKQFGNPAYSSNYVQ